ncbi:MAG: hypothetical protein ACT4OP_02545 [Actinomycetota bacterium]
MTELVDQVEGLIERWKAGLKVRHDASARRLLPILPGLPLIDSATAAKACGVSRRAAQSALDQLERAGIITRLDLPPAGIGRPDQRYLAEAVLRLLDR